MRGAQGQRRAVAIVLAVVTAGAALMWSVPAGAQGSSVPGVTAKEIKIGAVVAKTNPTGLRYEDAITGAKAYFDQVNKQGGVSGRKFKIVATFDDQTRASKNLLAARTLVEETKVFAIVPMATSEFTSADYLVQHGTPTFGYDIQSDWSKGPNLFGAYGSYICFDCPAVSPAFVAQQVGAKRAAIFAYGSSPQSAQCAVAEKMGFDKYGPKAVSVDTSLAFGFSANDISAAVQSMKDNQVDFVATCMDIQGEVNLQKALKASGVSGTKFEAPQGYDQQTLEQLGADLDGFTFPVRFVPFELAKGNAGMTNFVKTMKARGLAPTENLLVGWNSAALLVEGIKRAGKDFTQKSVVDAINQITDWTANGTEAPVNWKTAHGPPAPGEQSCFSYVTPKNGKFVSVYGQPGKPIVCFGDNPYPSTLGSPTYIG